AQDGGAIGNGPQSTQDDIALSFATFTNNSAHEIGGAIYSGTGTTRLSVTNSIFTGNSAAGGGAIFNTQLSEGGSMSVSGSTFEDNSAAGNGGAIDNGESGSGSTGTVSDSTFLGNT